MRCCAAILFTMLEDGRFLYCRRFVHDSRVYSSVRLHLIPIRRDHKRVIVADDYLAKHCSFKRDCGTSRDCWLRRVQQHRSRGVIPQGTFQCRLKNHGHRPKDSANRPHDM